MCLHVQYSMLLPMNVEPPYSISTTQNIHTVGVMSNNGVFNMAVSCHILRNKKCYDDKRGVTLIFILQF